MSPRTIVSGTDPVVEGCVSLAFDGWDYADSLRAKMRGNLIALRNRNPETFARVFGPIAAQTKSVPLVRKTGRNATVGRREAE